MWRVRMFEDKERRLVEFVRQYLVDFINAETDEARYKKFNAITPEGINFLMDGRLVILDGGLKDLPLDYDYDEFRYEFDEIERFQRIVLKMLRIALIDGEFKKLYPEANKKTIEETDLEEYIRDLFINRKQTETFRWRGRGETYILPDHLKKACFHDEFEYIIIKALVDIFESQFGEEAIGYQYFSFCPKCGKFFYKEWIEQVYCSERCRDSARSLKHLKKKREANTNTEN